MTTAAIYPLPENVGADVAAEIEADPEAFMDRVRATRYAMARNSAQEAAR